MKRIAGGFAALVLLLAGCGSSPGVEPIAQSATTDVSSSAPAPTGINSPDVVACSGLAGVWGGFLQNDAVKAMTTDPYSTDWDAVHAVSETALKEGDRLRPKLSDPASSRLWKVWNAAGVTFTAGLESGDSKVKAMQKVADWMKSGNEAIDGCSDLIDRSTS